jgi:hypothetical protein
MNELMKLDRDVQMAIVFGTAAVAALVVYHLGRFFRAIVGDGDVKFSYTETKPAEDTDAADALTDLALSYNISRKDIDNADSWDDVTTMIKTRVARVVLMTNPDPTDWIKSILSKVKPVPTINDFLNPQKSPTLTATRYYVRRGDGLFYARKRDGGPDWTSRANAMSQTCPLAAKRLRQELETLNPGIKFTVVDEEVTQ